jgi:hypothetical protein
MFTEKFNMIINIITMTLIVRRRTNSCPIKRKRNPRIIQNQHLKNDGYVEFSFFIFCSVRISIYQFFTGI